MNKDRIVNQFEAAQMGIGFKNGYEEVDKDAFDRATEREVLKKQAPTSEINMEPEVIYAPADSSQA